MNTTVKTFVVWTLCLIFVVVQTLRVREKVEQLHVQIECWQFSLPTCFVGVGKFNTCQLSGQTDPILGRGRHFLNINKGVVMWV